MSHNITVAEPAALASPSGPVLHPVIVAAGPEVAERFLEFFVGTIRNPNTRAAYVQAVGRFLDWCAGRELALGDVRPLHVAAYAELLTAERAASTVKQHLAAIRGAFGHLVTGGALPSNPASEVRGPSISTRKGKTPVLFAEDAAKLLASIDTSHLVGLRDRAFIAVMLYSFARVSAVCGMRVKDYEVMGRRATFVFNEKGGVEGHRVPVHHRAAEYVEAYLATGDLGRELESPLFRSSRGRSRTLTDRGMSRSDALRMVKRRAETAGFPPHAVCNHTCRATGITNFMENGGVLEVAQSIAAHASTKTTQLYDRTPERVSLSEVERVRF